MFERSRAATAVTYRVLRNSLISPRYEAGMASRAEKRATVSLSPETSTFRRIADRKSGRLNVHRDCSSSTFRHISCGLHENFRSRENMKYAAGKMCGKKIEATRRHVTSATPRTRTHASACSPAHVGWPHEPRCLPIVVPAKPRNSAKYADLRIQMAALHRP